MFADPDIRREIQRKREQLVVAKKDLTILVKSLLDSSLDSEALQHSLRIEMPTKNTKKHQTRYKSKEIRNAASNLKTAWHYGNLNFTLPPSQDFMIKLVRFVEPGIRQTVNGYRADSVRALGSLIPPYPQKIEYCMQKFYADLSELCKGYASKEYIVNAAPDIAAWMHLHVARIHPFQDGNGRTARIMQNLTLTHTDHPPIIVKESERNDYLEVLDAACVGFRARDGENNPAYSRKKISEEERLYYDVMGMKLIENMSRILRQYQTGK